MTIHVSATTGCNLGCTYCYENPDRERKQEWVDRQYDIEKIMSKLEDWKQKKPDTMPGMHGGEPLLVRTEHLERIFKWIHENYDTGPDQRAHIQTNGTLLTDEHIEIFEKYYVHVGISCDGPEELNEERKAAGERGTDSGETTARMTERTHDAIEKVMDSDTTGGVIVVLSEANAGTDKKFEKLLDWMDYLCENNFSGHFNPAIPYEDVPDGEDIALDPSILKDRYLRTWEWMKAEPHRTWNPMRDYVDNLLGNKLGNCVNNKCDVFNAGAAQIITGDGETTGCGKTWGKVGDGVPFLQGDSTGNEYDDTEERYEMLKNTPGWVTDGAPDMGGCKGCKYWNVCQGGGPCAGANHDYRNRTRWCEAKFALYEKIEHDMRAILPNITLITDYQWNAKLAEEATKWNLDIKPFVAMDPGVPGRSSASGGFSHDAGSPDERVPERVLPELTWEERKKHLREQYDEDVLIIDDDERYAHADSEMHWSRVNDSEEGEE